MVNQKRTLLLFLFMLLLDILPAKAEIPVPAASALGSSCRERQTTSTVLMVSPDDFAYNTQTAGSNYFQNRSSSDAGKTQKEALGEFDAMVAKLGAAGIRVIRMQSRRDVKTPDAVFPNNWFSLHSPAKGVRTLVLYPMLAPDRRAERRPGELEQRLAAEGLPVKRVIDLSGFEHQGRFLEGTGSVVLDRVNRIAYASISPRTDLSVLQEFSRKLHYRPVSFHSYDSADSLVYHTNVMMSVGRQFAVICAESIRDLQERNHVLAELQHSGKQVITITRSQMGRMCGNILELRTSRGPMIVMSRTAYDHFTPMQRKVLQRFGTLLPVQIPTIEDVGGGSARCMLGEVY